MKTPFIKDDTLPKELKDVKGKIIRKGDLIRSFHFTGPRKKKYYLYHVVTIRDGYFYCRPVQYLDPTIKDTGGNHYLMKQKEIEDYEMTIINRE